MSRHKNALLLACALTGCGGFRAETKPPTAQECLEAHDGNVRDGPTHERQPGLIAVYPPNLPTFTDPRLRTAPLSRDAPLDRFYCRASGLNGIVDYVMKLAQWCRNDNAQAAERDGRKKVCRFKSFDFVKVARLTITRKCKDLPRDFEKIALVPRDDEPDWGPPPGLRDEPRIERGSERVARRTVASEPRERLPVRRRPERADPEPHAEPDRRRARTRPERAREADPGPDRRRIKRFKDKRVRGTFLCSKRGMKTLARRLNKWCGRTRDCDSNYFEPEREARETVCSNCEGAEIARDLRCP